MEGDVMGVRITPSLVEFIDANPGECYKTQLIVKNISKTSKRIRFHPPNTNKFRLTVRNITKPVAPGLDIPATVEYFTDTNEDARDRIILAVDDDIIEIPLYAYIPTPLLDLEGPVNFGTVVANSKVLSKEVALINHGSMPGEFKISYNGKMPIVIMPTSGKVNPKTVQMIKVELVSEIPGEVDERARVKLEGLQDTELVIRGNIVEQTLQVLHMDGSILKCVPFGSTYYGTDQIEQAYLYNNGPEPIKWVSVLEDGAAGEEAGSDLTKSTAATLATSPMEKIRGKAYDVLTSLLTVFPNQGVIEAYQKIPIYFRFSPRFNSSNVGWEHTEKPPPRQDFALFMTFDIVGSNDTFFAHSSRNPRHVEIAVTATALPVLVNIQPTNVVDFGELKCKESKDILIKLVNESAVLPLTLEFCKVAHFTVDPDRTKILPGQNKEIGIRFHPRQAGSFKPIQVINVIGKVIEGIDDDEESDNIGPPKLVMQTFQTIPMQYLGISVAVPVKKQPKLNPGITPILTNETGQFHEVSFAKTMDVKEQLRAAIVSANKTALHSHEKLDNAINTLVAFPNDRAQSIRPAERGKEFRTPFTQMKRHTFIDPDYAFKPEEENQRKEHKQKYVDYIRNSTKNRQAMAKEREFKLLNNDSDISIKPAAGLKPLQLSVNDVETSFAKLTPAVTEKQRLLTTRDLANQERNTATRPISDGLNAVPTTDVEKGDCQVKLSPQDLHKIIIGPPTIDYGEVCLRSTNINQLRIMNNLNQYIHVHVSIDCRELRQTSPLSQVVPPMSKAQLALIFESTVEGKFQRSISYTVNGQHESHVLVLATVVPVALELSTHDLELEPTAGLPCDSGYRAHLTLYNRRNYAAEFTWSPILTDRGTAFSIRPATGMVEADKDLKCEIVFHPSYFAPLEGNFHIQVHNDNSMKLKCVAKLGHTNVQFVERRIQFGSVPLNMQTVRTALLHNSGRNHAMFYVMNSNPFPGMVVTPVHGIVPVGGNTELKVYLTPSAVMKFDTWIRVNIRGWKTIDLRMGGTVDAPAVDIDVKAFKFSGVYVNSVVTMPFNLVNLTSTRVKCEFDLSKYEDFTLKFPTEEVDDDPNDQISLEPNYYTVELAGNQILACSLTFHPTSVAAYDFQLPVVINKTDAASPSPSTMPPTPAPSERHIVTPRPVIVTIATPQRRVVGIALRTPLEVSETRLEFNLPVPNREMSLPDNVGDQKTITLENTTLNQLRWKIDAKKVKNFADSNAFIFLRPGGAWYNSSDISGTLEANETLNLRIMFCPKNVGSFYFKLPLILNDDYEKPYRIIELFAILKLPEINFDPLALVLTPVPLATSVYADFNIIASGYLRETAISVNVPAVDAEDGSKVNCFTVEFPDGNVIRPPSSGESVVIPCTLSFIATKPLSTCIDITFKDFEGRKFNIPVTATADNCLLTVYPFLAAHRNDHQIVVEQDKTLRGPMEVGNSTSVGEAVLLPCVSPNRPATRGSTSATSSHFGASSSTYEESSASDSDSEFAGSSRDGAQTAPRGEASDEVTSQNQMSSKTNIMRKELDTASSQLDPHVSARQDLVSRSLGSAAFPFDSSLEAHFHHEVLQSVQRWISNHGWPNGPFPISVPHSLRSLVTRMPYDDSETGPVPSKARTRATGDRKLPPPRPQYHGSDTSNLRKDVKTIYDMFQHLCGRMVPGIPINQPLPRDPTERVLQLHWQHSTLLTFLRGQGASIAAIRPEFLLTPRDYRRWVKIKEREAKAAAKAKPEESDINSETNDLTTLTSSDDKLTLGLDKLTPSMMHIEKELFESVSKRAWTDLILQLIKVFVLARVTPKQYKAIKPIQNDEIGLPNVNSDPLASNVYSVGERIILAWLNHHYEQQRHIVWGSINSNNESDKGGVPPSRWVVNFDFDLLDGLVLAAVVAAHCPWLINDYFRDMFTSPSSPEQCLHNTLILGKAIRHVGIDYDIQATDITDPNPISLLLFCVHLYQNLPQYVPRSNVQFSGSLHSIVRRQVRVTNPSSKPLIYMVSISGKDADDFSLPTGNEITVPARSDFNLDIEFRSRFLRPAEAILTLVGRRETAFGGIAARGFGVGSTLVFTMEAYIDDIKPLSTVKSETPCYELKEVALNVTNPFKTSGRFRVILIESSDTLPTPVDVGRVTTCKSKKSTLSTRIKTVRSRTDHGQRSPTKSRSDQSNDSMNSGKSPDQAETRPHNQDRNRGVSITKPNTNQLTAFFYADSHVELEARKKTKLTLQYLPFYLGKKYCSVLFTNDVIGDFLYAVEAMCVRPQPSKIPFNPKSQQAVRISSAQAAEKGKGLFGGNECVVYWKCETGTVLEETLLIPITNQAKERALITAAQLRMSKQEMDRRQLTGTLESGTVTAAVAAMGFYDVSDLNPRAPSHLTSAPPLPKGEQYSVECSSKCFTLPSTLTMPSPMTFGPPPASEIKGSKFGPNDRQDDGTVQLKVKFKSMGPGHYPCEILLKSANDIRVYRIECTVTPPGTIAKFEFSTPAHQPITQVIPIQNASDHDWNLLCRLDGIGFYGPEKLLAKCGETSYYKLTFKPHYECDIAGKLIIKNESDDTEHIFHLRGVGEHPLALDTIEMACQCRNVVTRTVDVPNYTQHKLAYHAVSDIPFLDGPPTIVVLPGQTGSYSFTVRPWSRGEIEGILRFEGHDFETSNVQLLDDSDSDMEDEIEKGSMIARKKKPSEDKIMEYSVWYSVLIHAEPPKPERTIEVACPAQKSTIIEIPINNPTTEVLEFDVAYDGQYLTGDNRIKLQPKIPATYKLKFMPPVIGRGTGSVVFNCPMTGEFWYKLDLTSVTPPPATFPPMECELGRWTRQYLSISNTTERPMTMTAEVSNPNFFLDLPVVNEQPVLEVPPLSAADIPIQFMPTILGGEGHDVTITFHSAELGDLKFWGTGRGLVPKTMEPISVSANVHSNTSLIMPFRNPTNKTVLADIYFVDKEQLLNQISESVIRSSITVESAFCLLLKHTNSIRLEPKQSIDIPFTFSPDQMRLFEGVLTVALSREDGEPWPEETSGVEDLTGTNKLDMGQNDVEHIRPLTRSMDGSIFAIRWVFPVHGIPEVRSKGIKQATLQCQARSRIEERLEVILSGALSSSSSNSDLMRLRAVTPLDKQRTDAMKMADSVAVEGHFVAEEFSYEVDYPSVEAKQLIESALVLNLVRKERNQSNGIVTLLFNLVFSPFKPLNHKVTLTVTSANGGVWKFPLAICATEPPPDDTITIEAAGINKKSVVAFVLFSHSKHPTPFTASFMEGSDKDFTVMPQDGQLMPVGSSGTQINITFSPPMYGKSYNGKLIIQTPDMQWTYDVKGVTPEYTPPVGHSSTISSGPRRLSQRPRVNYIRKNLKLIATSVSSPIKGAPLVIRTK